MILIVCIDDAGGMMFNHRRQSQDRVLRARIAELTEGAELWVTPYTARQFEAGASLRISDTPWTDAGAGEYYFAEDGEICAKSVEKVYLFHWNRLYPSDCKLTLDLHALGFTLAESREFAGYSHECITEEIYIKES